ncbi:MAG: GPW/gp25 family protein [Alphaproteobacteria bacterium]|nr:GPW/gp25 family protein [Alphaproteobacteria bacterium]MBO4700443.1 GPW/gp25 family protein [Alphaproteobacteria bacterium]MBQ6110529.1 GPW/gp25 family protein [Alphaproteobacteria bacterium]
MQGMNINTGRTISDMEHLRQSITNILSTPIGSRIMRRDYGSRLFKRLDAPLTGELMAEIYADVVEALFSYEPRFEVTNVSVVSMDQGHLILDVTGKYLITGEDITLTGIEIQ